MAAEKIILLAGRALTSEAGTGPTVVLGADRSYAMVTLDVDVFIPPAVPLVTPALAVKFDTAASLTGNWAELYTATALAPSVQVFPLISCDFFLRARWTLTAGLTASHAITGTSYQLYAHGGDVKNTSLPKATTDGIPADILAWACLVATDEAASYLAKHKTLPLVSWNGALRMHVANMAAYHAMKRRGFDVDNDKLIRLGYTDALAWLAGPAANDPGIIDSTPTVSAQEAFMVSRPERGWAHR